MKKLKVYGTGQYLMWEDEKPFFYLGDTAWELFHRLTREEMAEYFAVRAKFRRWPWQNLRASPCQTNMADFR